MLSKTLRAARLANLPLQSKFPPIPLLAFLATPQEPASQVEALATLEKA